MEIKVCRGSCWICSCITSAMFIIGIISYVIAWNIAKPDLEVTTSPIHVDFNAVDCIKPLVAAFVIYADGEQRPICTEPRPKRKKRK